MESLSVRSLPAVKPRFPPATPPRAVDQLVDGHVAAGLQVDVRAARKQEPEFARRTRSDPTGRAGIDHEVGRVEQQRPVAPDGRLNVDRAAESQRRPSKTPRPGHRARRRGRRARRWRRRIGSRRRTTGPLVPPSPRAGGTGIDPSTGGDLNPCCMGKRSAALPTSADEDAAAAHRCQSHRSWPSGPARRDRR